MHRVELKDGLFKVYVFQRQWFLMHRVELKVYGVSYFLEFLQNVVPNAPCGVESISSKPSVAGVFDAMFLMHRVELKVEKRIRFLEALQKCS